MVETFPQTSCTAAIVGIFSRSFCVTATRTVITLAAGPVILIFTMGPSKPSSVSPPPPVPTRYGRISSNTVSTLGAVSSRPLISSMTCSTSKISGIFSISRRLMPMVMVVRELGQEPQAPLSFNLTTRPSISTNSTLPPSDMRYGRTSSNTVSTFCSVKSMVSSCCAAAKATTNRAVRTCAAQFLPCCADTGCTGCANQPRLEVRHTGCAIEWPQRCEVLAAVEQRPAA
mmetsp:Transcript_8630/g.14844  ORF Transcript_8630/g.14844 Transcript_8630/m.14844 type:complete len:229 (-) Transcript_8630:16-702(-)